MKQRKARKAAIRKALTNPRRGVVLRLLIGPDKYTELMYGTPELAEYTGKIFTGEIGTVDCGFRFIES